MKILVTGANGLLGQHLVNDFAGKGHEVLGLGKGTCRLPETIEGQWTYRTADISDVSALEAATAAFGRPDVFIHAAAETQVDACETNQANCYRTNVTGTENSLLLAKKFDCQFIFISTDFVFNGEQGLYKEEDAMDPINYYGQTKMEGERLVEKHSSNHAILRTCLVYDNALQGTRSNIMTWVKDNLDRGQSIKVVSDQIRTPTYIGDLVKGVELTMLSGSTGIFHISGEEVFTPYDMAMSTVAHFNLDGNLITKVDASVFSQPGKRPLKTGFNIEKAKRLLGYQPISFLEGMRKMYPSFT